MSYETLQNTTDEIQQHNTVAAIVAMVVALSAQHLPSCFCGLWCVSNALSNGQDNQQPMMLMTATRTSRLN